MIEFKITLARAYLKQSYLFHAYRYFVLTGIALEKLRDCDLFALDNTF